MRYEILVGDVMDKLGTLADESVHCTVTSPPYWGLRDYGTGTWEGGNQLCDHLQPEGEASPRRDVGCSTSSFNGSVVPSELKARQFTDVCGKCNAIRVDQQIGLEKTPGEYIAKMVAVFREVRRVLRNDATCWVNMGDSYTSGDRATWRSGVSENKGQDVRNDMSRPGTPPGLKPKDLCGMPWRLAFALQADGWWLRQDIIWSKPNPMPESVIDRCTKAHEYLFLLTKSARYFYDAEAIKEPVTGGAHARGDGVNPKAHGANSGMNVDRDPTHLQASNMKQNSSYSAAITELVGTRNKRSVWEIATEAFPEAHFATFPTKLVEPCILAGTSEKGCCEACGAPWVRKLEQVDTGRKQKMADGWDTGDGGHGTVHRDGRESGEAGKSVMLAKTIGWKPSCKCSAPATPCTVLDPFNGSGTTGLVALANRCNYIGIELNPEYAAMSERRLAAATAQGVLV